MAVGTWTDPKTWVDGETPTGAQFNTQFRDNLNYLKNNPTFDGGIAIGGSITVGGNVTAVDISASGDVSVGDDLTVTGDLVVKGTTALGDALTDLVDIKGLIIGAPLKTYSETISAPVISGGALALDCLQSTYFAVALNSNCAVTCPNLPAGRPVGLTVVFTGDGTIRVVTWPAGTVWPENITPSLTGTAGKRDIFTLLWDGTSFFGVIVGLNY